MIYKRLSLRYQGNATSAEIDGRGRVNSTGPRTVVLGLQRKTTLINALLSERQPLTGMEENLKRLKCIQNIGNTENITSNPFMKAKFDFLQNSDRQKQNNGQQKNVNWDKDESAQDILAQEDSTRVTLRSIRNNKIHEKHQQI